MLKWGRRLIRIDDLKGQNGLTGFAVAYNSVIARIYRRMAIIYMYALDALRKMEYRITPE